MAPDEEQKLVKSELAEAFSAGETPESAWRVGTEIEALLFTIDAETGACTRVPYHASVASQVSIPALLKALGVRTGADLLAPEGHLLGLRHNGWVVTLEPGGQIEFSSAPHGDLIQLNQEIQAYGQALLEVAHAHQVLPVLIGMDPVTRLSDVDWIPKERYTLMRNRMPQVGEMGLLMMGQTCSVQANLDFVSEADMVRKFRLMLTWGPFVAAAFANSPFREGRDSGYQSYRGYIWQHTDVQRSGLLPFVFEEGMGYERYVTYLLDMPMYSVKREGRLWDTRGVTFRHFMDHGLEGTPAAFATWQDWDDHIGCVFPEVRLKKILEVRGADAVSPAAAMALNAFWVGALYDPETMEALETLSRTWSVADLQDVQRRVPREGRAALFQGRTCHEWLRLALDEVTQSLVRRGKGEDRFLIPLRDVLTQQPSFADQTRACFDSTQSWEAVLKLNQWHNESAETV